MPQERSKRVTLTLKIYKESLGLSKQGQKKETKPSIGAGQTYTPEAEENIIIFSYIIIYQTTHAKKYYAQANAQFAYTPHQKRNFNLKIKLEKKQLGLSKQRKKEPKPPLGKGKHTHLRLMRRSRLTIAAPDS